MSFERPRNMSENSSFFGSVSRDESVSENESSTYSPPPKKSLCNQFTNLFYGPPSNKKIPSHQELRIRYYPGKA